MSFRFTPGCCCRQADTIDPCIPDCQEIFSGFYNQIYYEGHAGHYGTLPGKDDAGSYDSVSYVTIDNLANYDYTGPDCALFVLSATSSVISGTRYYTFSAYKTNKDISGLSSSQYGTHIIGRNVTTYTYAVPKYDSTSQYSRVFDYFNTSGNIVSAAISVGGISSVNTLSNKPIDEKEYRNYIRVYSYDSFHHSIQDVKYTRLFCLPFDICEYRFHFTYVETGRYPGWDNPRLLVTPNSSFTQFYVPITGKEETEDCELSCGFTIRDTCAAQVPSEYATIFNASDIATALNSLTNDNIIDYWTVRLYGIRPPAYSSGFNEYSRFFDAAEFGVVVVWTSDGTKIPVVMGNISVSNCALTFDSFDTGYNTSPNNIDYPTLLISYSHLDASTGELADSSIESSIVFGSENGNIPSIWHSNRLNDENYKTNATRFNGIYWVYASITPCNSPFSEKVTVGGIGGTASSNTVARIPIAIYSINNTEGNWERVRHRVTEQHSGYGYYDEHGEVWRTPMTFIRSLADFSIADIDSYLPLNWSESLITNYKKDSRIHKPPGYRLKKLVYGVHRLSAWYISPWPEMTLYNRLRISEQTSMTGTSGGYIGPYSTTNIEHTEEVIYDSGFKTLTDENGETVYVPSVSSNIVDRILGSAGSYYFYEGYTWITLQPPWGIPEKPNFYLEDISSTIYVMPVAEFIYMAVWEPDNE